jgi:hypothetical protein
MECLALDTGVSVVRGGATFQSMVPAGKVMRVTARLGCRGRHT